MKKILAIILAITPFLLMGQVKGDYMLRVNYGMVFDENHTDLDIDEHSPDLYSEYNGRDDVKNALKFSGGYYLKENLLIGLSYMNSEISGSNDIEFWDGEFTETSLFAEYEFFEEDGLGIYATGGGGTIDFDAFRSLMLDDGQVPLNSYSDNAIKYHYGGGVTYVINDLIKLNLEISRNIVNHDGFDGWDYGSGEDRYLYKSVGISFLLGGNNNDKVEELKEIIEAPVVVKEPIEVVEDTIEVVEEVIETVIETPAKVIIIKEPVRYDFTIYFGSDSDLITNSSDIKITEIQKLLSIDVDYTVLLVGYADSDGNESYNLDLSNRRVTNVLNKLISLGVDSDKLKSSFKGEKFPIDTNLTEDGKKNNRVVTISFSL